MIQGNHTLKCSYYALCGCVFDAIRPVSAVPSAQRGHFFFRDPAIIWKKGKLGAFGSAGASLLLGERPKVSFSFRPPGAQKTAETGRFKKPA